MYSYDFTPHRKFHVTPARHTNLGILASMLVFDFLTAGFKTHLGLLERWKCMQLWHF